MNTPKTASPLNLVSKDIKRALKVSKSWDDAKFKSKTGYSASRKYGLLRPSGRLVPAKAIVALAFKLRFKGEEMSENFSGGKGPGCAGTILADLGFSVTGINAKMPKAKKSAKKAA